MLQVKVSVGFNSDVVFQFFTGAGKKKNSLLIQRLLNSPKSSKYDLLVEEEVGEEEEMSSHRLSDRKHKDKRHHHDSESEGRKPKKHKVTLTHWLTHSESGFPRFISSDER